VSGAAPALTERFRAALALAEEVHGGTRRSGTEIPYLAHLLVVTGLVLEDGGEEDEAIAAILHDSVEDGGGRPLLERIRREFGERVAEIVEQLSDSIETDTNESWIDRKRRYLEDLQECQDEAALRVSLADKVNNARAIVREYRAEGDALWERFAEKTADQQLWYYARLVEIFEAKRPGPLTEDLRRAFDELRALVADRDRGA
jgi:(p)ppGpp synthase/HD superfamily hydrolase